MRVVGLLILLLLLPSSALAGEEEVAVLEEIRAEINQTLTDFQSNEDAEQASERFGEIREEIYSITWPDGCLHAAGQLYGSTLILGGFVEEFPKSQAFAMGMLGVAPSQQYATAFYQGCLLSF